MLFLLANLFGLTLSYEVFDYHYIARTQLPDLNFSETFFPSLTNHEINTTLVNESEYPWIARVVHSVTTDVPYMCTASCIRERVFITAARCIYTLKVAYTSLIYQKKHQLPAQVIILPSNRTKQSYDDIGFIVVKIPKESVDWKQVELYNTVNRTDDRYGWFSELPTTGFMVVGFAAKRKLQPIMSTSVPFNLTELEVNIGMDLCPEILVSDEDLIRGFNVPCYFACTVRQFFGEDSQCLHQYHGVEGGAIIEIKSNRLLGVATWGVFHDASQYLLPVGFSVANSEIFYKDYECANAIVEDNSVTHTDPLYYQTLCDRL